MKANATVGFYGKLPMLGDFVSRRLPHEFISAWDKWLQSAIAVSHEQLGSQWLDYYLTSPIWRFGLSSGLCGKSAWAGIMMPSVDKVGRYFPLTIAVPFEHSSSFSYLFAEGDSWFEYLEAVALSGLENNLDLQAFDQLIQAIPAFEFPDVIMLDNESEYLAKKVFHLVKDSYEAIDCSLIGLESCLFNSIKPGSSLWSTTDTEIFNSVVLVCDGMPPINSYSRFLNGNVLVQEASILPEPVYTDNNTSQQDEDRTVSIFTKAEPNTLSELVPIIIDPLYWQSWSATDTGKRRKYNEDSLLDKPDAGLWVVADGMGGHKAGDVASQLIVSTLSNIMSSESLEDTLREVEKGLQQVNLELRELAERKYGSHIVGSTVVALICKQDRCAYVWAGDSRLYRFRDNKLIQLTQDHCAEEEYESLESGWSVKTSNVITRAVGADDQLDLDYQITDIQQGDVFLLCSDGLDKEISFNELEMLMQTHEHHELVDILINKTLEYGARDNVTVIVVEVVPA